YFPPYASEGTLRRLMNLLFTSIIDRDAIDQTGALPLVEQGPFRADFGVLLARHHLDVRPGLLLARLLDREPPIEPFDPVRELLRAPVLEAVQDLSDGPHRAALPGVHPVQPHLPE